MKKIIITLVLFKILCIPSADAQNFFPLSPGFNSEVRSLFYDSSANVLYAGGNFTKLAGNTIPMNHISRWNGSVWDSLGSGLFGNVYSIVKYNGFIYAGGNFGIKNSLGNIIYPANIAYWDGFYWQLPPGGASANSAVGELFVNGNDLYVGGVFDTINSIPAQGIARYDGTVWHSYPQLAIVNTVNAVDIKIYNGELYVAGDFNDGPGLMDIVKFDGSNWVTVGGGLSGFSTDVWDMLVYQGELYIVGDFHVSTGDPGNCIAKWNGSTWSSVGAGLNSGGQLFALTSFKNEIYVGGSFLTIASISSPCIAKWNGSNWSSLGSTFNNAVECFIPYGNDLYIGGGFITVDNDTMRAIIRYSPPLAIEENISSDAKIIISPNPLQDVITIKSATNFSATEIILFDTEGRKVIEKKFNKDVSFSVSQLGEGIYFYKIKDSKGKEVNGKVVKE